MFYEGDLQSGISKAVEESKLVCCFVTDDGEGSQLWENEFLAEPDLRDALRTETVLLRLKAGSQEAGYLAAIFPIPKTPTLVLIQNGQLKEYIASGVSKEEFSRRLTAVFQSREATRPLEAVRQLPELPSASSASNEAPSTASDQPVEVISPAATSQAPPPPSQNPPPRVETQSAVQSLLAERSARLEAHKKESEAKEKAERLAAAKAKKEAMEASAEPGSKQSADMKYALMQKKRQQEAREERARILKRVEDDKEERRQREARRKAQADGQGDSQRKEAEISPSSSILSSSNNAARECALQIRLFDGSTIRSRFPSLGSLRSDVRPWIDARKRVDIPYTFKHILTPLPNKTISITEEQQSLRSLALPPSATLILVPVNGYTSAYEDGASLGLVSRWFNAVYNWLFALIAMLTGVLGGIFARAAPPAAAEQEPSAPPSAPPPAAAASRINIRTLRDQDERREDQQFYNGNALNFEPRRDDEDTKQE